MKSDPIQPTHDGFRPGRLWSLWEVLKFNGQDFFRVATSFATVREKISVWPSNHSMHVGPIREDNRPMFKTSVGVLVETLDSLGAKLSLMRAKRLLARFDATPFAMTYAEYIQAWDDVESRLRDELSSIKLFVMDARNSDYFAPGDFPFGPEATERIPHAIPDMEDAGRCLAFNQGTAAVFHLMRVMEAALKSLAGLLGIPYAPSWESYIGQIERCIREKHKRKTVQWKRDEPFYLEILGNLQTIKIAWRNPTMHIVRRYSVDEAEEIYIAVRGFVQRVAPRLPMPKTKKSD